MTAASIHAAIQALDADAVRLDEHGSMMARRSHGAGATTPRNTGGAGERSNFVRVGWFTQEYPDAQDSRAKS
jgi:hypothetical protein